MKRSILKIQVIALAVIFLAGCSIFAPRTAALKSVHQTYRDDFAHWVVPSPAIQPAPPTTTNQPSFSATLQAIRDFRTRYGEDSAEAAHLIVLEGMIYVQSGRLGMAQLIAPDVAKAGKRLHAATGEDVRDALFAENFPSLLKGWAEIHDARDANDNTITEWSKLRDAADAIVEQLNDAIKAKRLADAAADQGGIYLATTAGIFYVWAYAFEKIENPRQAEDDKKVWYKKSQELIGNFLSPTEKKAAGDSALAGDSIARLRYLEWYAWFGNALTNP